MMDDLLYTITLLIKNIRGLKELSNVSKHRFKSSYKDVIYQVYKENWGIILLKISVLITGHVEHDIRKCFSSSISPDVQRRQSLSCRRAPCLESRNII
jgi:hypothetical protein